MLVSGGNPRAALDPCPVRGSAAECAVAAGLEGAGRAGGSAIPVLDRCLQVLPPLAAFPRGLGSGERGVPSEPMEDHHRHPPGTPLLCWALGRGAEGGTRACPQLPATHASIPHPLPGCPGKGSAARIFLLQPLGLPPSPMSDCTLLAQPAPGCSPLQKPGAPGILGRQAVLPALSPPPCPGLGCTRPLPAGCSGACVAAGGGGRSRSRLGFLY